MRDNLCQEDELNETIEIGYEEREDCKKRINELMDDISNGVSRYPKKNEDIIASINRRMFSEIEELIDAKYSAGHPCEELEELYEELIYYAQVSDFEWVKYVNFILAFSLGILLEVSDSKLQIFVDEADDKKLNDIYFDYLVSLAGLKRRNTSTKYVKSNPYKIAVEIIETAKIDKDKATKKLKEYISQKWLKGHSDMGFTTAHKEYGYVGLWSYDTGALAKMLGIGDDALQNDNHYPYDLVHYKNNKKYSLGGLVSISEIKESESNIKVGIELNHDLEKLVPIKYHELVNQIIYDYEKISDEEMYEKYNLEEVWFSFEAYTREKTKGVLGFIIVCILVDKGFILQLDWKEDFEEYREHIENYFENEDTKIISFEIDNDQQYYARVPLECDVKSIYEITVNY